jgi:hypothetical protein
MKHPPGGHSRLCRGLPLAFKGHLRSLRRGIATMSSSTSQCAVGLDGTLLDASDIQWFNDPDDDDPLPPVSSSGPTPPENGAVSPSRREIHPFFKPSAPPAGIIAGARRSTRAIRPSARAIDPNNIEASSSTTHKRSREASPPSRRNPRKITQSDAEASEHNDTLASESDTAEAETELDKDGDDVADEHSRLQMMADADHEVNPLHLSRLSFIWFILAGLEFSYQE